MDIEKCDFDKIKQKADGHDSLGAKWYEKDKLTLEELSPLAKCLFGE